MLAVHDVVIYVVLVLLTFEHTQRKQGGGVLGCVKIMNDDNERCHN